MSYPNPTTGSAPREVGRGGSVGGTLFLRVALLGVLLAVVPGGSSARAQIIIDDPFGRGARIVTSTLGTAQPAALFDGSDVDPGSVTFFPNVGVGAQAGVVFDTGPLTLTGIRLHAANDGAPFGFRRTMSRFRFFADVNADGVLAASEGLVDQAIDVDYDSGQIGDLDTTSKEIEFEFTFPAATAARRWSVVVTQGSAVGLFEGVRVQEIDGVVAPLTPQAPTASVVPTTDTATTIAPTTTAPVRTPPPIPTTRAVAPTTAAPVPTTPPEPSTVEALPAPPPERPQVSTANPRSQKAAAKFIDAVPSPGETAGFAQMAQNTLLTIFFLALISLPVNLINGMAESHSDRLGGETVGIGARYRIEKATEWTSALPMGAVLGVAAVVSAILYGFLQPSFGLDEPSLALVIGVAVAVLVLNVVQRLSLMAFLRRAFSVGAFMRLLPGFAVVALGCVVVSRLLGLQPGLLLGPLATIGLRDEIGEEDLGKALAASYTVVAVFGLVAWFTRSLVLDLFDSGTLASEITGVAWTTLAIACTETVAFNMLPVRFLDGFPVFRWSKAAWVTLQLFGLFGFVHVLINPDSGAADFEGRTTYLGLLFLIYLVLAAALWGFLRWRAAVSAEPPPGRPDPGQEEPPFEPPPGPRPPQAPPRGGPAGDRMWAEWRAMQGSGRPAHHV